MVLPWRQTTRRNELQQLLESLKRLKGLTEPFFLFLYRYVPPLRPAHSKWSLELPDNAQALEEELAKQVSCCLL